VPEDWAAVSRAVNERMAELGLTQRELVERSHVSKATVMEIRRNVAQRRRSTRTLTAMSLALDWHPLHLDAVLNAQRIPAPGEPIIRTGDETTSRLAAIEYRLEQMSEQLGEMKDLGQRLDEMSSKIEEVIRHVRRR
jgi:transcriptional regulator with XRE-family HTH domain